jgi:hypothetical protein
VTLTNYRFNGSIAVISARGDIDASSTNDLSFYTVGRAAACREAGREWTTVPGAAVSRMLQIGDPLACLPVASTADAALAYVSPQTH